MKNIKKYCVISSLLSLSACINTVPPELYANRGDPESQLVATSEIVTIDLNSADAMERLSDELKQDRPTRILLNCAPQEYACINAHNIIRPTHVDVQYGEVADNIELVYEKVEARDCDSRYIDNTQNNRNLNHPSYGCSVRSNMVQMVTDKKQFTDPNLLDFRDGEKVGQNYTSYLTPTPPPPAANNAGLGEALVGTGSSQ